MFEVYNEAGKLTISADMVGFFCRRSGTGTCATSVINIGNTVRSQISIDVSGTTTPIVAIRMPGYGAAFAAVFNGQMQFATDAPIGTPFTYYLFDWSVALPIRANWSGMEIFNAAGQLTFSSDFHPFMALARDDYTRTDPAKVLAGASTTFVGHAYPTGFICYADQSEPNPVGPQPWSPGETCANLEARLDSKLYGAAVSADGTNVSQREISWDDVRFSIGRVGPDETIDSLNQRYGFEAPGHIFAVDVTGIPVGQTFF